MKRSTLSFLLCALNCMPLAASNTDDLLARRISEHLTIGDVRRAVEEAKEALEAHPSVVMKQALIGALARAGEEKEMLQAWTRYERDFPDQAARAQLLEKMAWGILAKAYTSPSPTARVYALVGAVLTRDVQAVPMLVHAMNDTSSILRAIAAQLAAHMGDDALAQEIVRMVHEEKSVEGRLAAIDAAGKMRIKSLEGKLRQLLAGEEARAEEKAAAIQAIAQIRDRIDPMEISLLALSPRAGLRQLACALIVAFDQEAAMPSAAALLFDTRPEVRAAALTAFGYLRPQEVAGKPARDWLAPCLGDSDPLCKTAAAWALALAGDDAGLEALEARFVAAEGEERALAAAALCSCGPAASEALWRLHAQEKEPIAKANLALGLVALRRDTQAACGSLAALLQAPGQLMWDKRGPFDLLLPSKIRHVEQMPSFPEVQDQMARLQIVHMLAVLNYPPTKAILVQSLRERGWGVTGAASVLLLQEEDEEAAALIRELLFESDDAVRLQAALVLASWFGDAQGVATLEAMYPQADADTKVKILEALGAVGEASTAPFLTECLHAPFQTQRVVAASSLIRSLNQ